MSTIEESTSAQEKLVAIQVAVNQWHETEKQRIIRDAVFLKSLQTPLEKNASYINNIANNALSLLQSIKEDGRAS